MKYIQTYPICIFEKFNTQSNHLWGGCAKLFYATNIPNRNSIKIQIPPNSPYQETLYVTDDINTALHAIRTTTHKPLLGPKINTVIAYQNNDLLIFDNTEKDNILIYEKPFKNTINSPWSTDTILKAFLDATKNIKDQPYICQGVALATLRNLDPNGYRTTATQVLKQHSNNHDLTWVSQFDTLYHHCIYTELMPNINPKRILQILDNNYAIIITTPAGTLLPHRPNIDLSEIPTSDYTFENAVPHIFMLIKEQNNMYIFIDEKGCRLITKEIIHKLSKINHRPEYKTQDTNLNTFILGINRRPLCSHSKT